MTSLRVALPLSLVFSAMGCNPYDQRNGEYNAGPVDPASFPAAYLGAGARAGQSGTGSFTETRAFVAPGMEAGYFSFPMTAAPGGQLGLADPLRLVDDGKPTRTPTPNAYVFDANPGAGKPFPDAARCKPPSGYTYDQRRDDVHYDEQGNVFTALPNASYVPIVSEVPVMSNGEDCQGIKSETTLLASKQVLVPPGPMVGGKPTAQPDGNYLAWALIDPGAAVYGKDEDQKKSQGVGPQRWGWYNHYLVAYIDGGYIPTELVKVTEMVGGKPVDKMVLRMKVQSLYFPRSMVIAGGKMAAGALGQGYDVLDAKRGDPGYSPVCAVYTYDAGAAKTVADLPKDAATIKAMYNPTMNPIKPASPQYVYCLQVK